MILIKTFLRDAQCELSGGFKSGNIAGVDDTAGDILFKFFYFYGHDFKKEEHIVCVSHREMYFFDKGDIRELFSRHYTDLTI